MRLPVLCAELVPGLNLSCPPWPMLPLPSPWRRPAACRPSMSQTCCLLSCGHRRQGGAVQLPWPPACGFLVAPLRAFHKLRVITLAAVPGPVCSMQANAVPTTFWALGFLLLPENKQHLAAVVREAQQAAPRPPEQQQQQQNEVDAQRALPSAEQLQGLLGLAADRRSHVAAAISETLRLRCFSIDVRIAAADGVLPAGTDGSGAGIWVQKVGVVRALDRPPGVQLIHPESLHFSGSPAVVEPLAAGRRRGHFAVRVAPRRPPVWNRRSGLQPPQVPPGSCFALCCRVAAEAALVLLEA